MLRKVLDRRGRANGAGHFSGFRTAALFAKNFTLYRKADRHVGRGGCLASREEDRRSPERISGRRRRLCSADEDDVGAEAAAYQARARARQLPSPQTQVCFSFHGRSLSAMGRRSQEIRARPRSLSSRRRSCRPNFASGRIRLAGTVCSFNDAQAYPQLYRHEVRDTMPTISTARAPRSLPASSRENLSRLIRDRRDQ